MKLNIPDIANGSVIPHSIKEKLISEEKEKTLRKKQFHHDWIIAISSAAIGGIFGFLSSLVFWLITK